jgi:hypothetical protein
VLVGTYESETGPRLVLAPPPARVVDLTAYRLRRMAAK